MASCAEQVQSCLVGLVQGRVTDPSGLARGLRRLAAKAMWSAKGGREPSPEEVDDLVQELLLKVVRLRAQRGGPALASEWRAMPPGKFYAYVRAMLRNLAVEENPAWDTQRALRDVVKAALADGLPAAKGLPVSVERGGRFARAFVAEACAELVARGVERNVTALTPALMSEYGLAAQAQEVSEELEAHAPSALEVLAARSAGEAVAAKLAAAVRPEELQLWRLKGLGVAEAARRTGLALSTAYARISRVERAFKALLANQRLTEAEAASALLVLATSS